MLPQGGILSSPHDPTGGPAPAHGRRAALRNMKTEPAVTAIAPQPGHYDIDPDRSRVTFATRHLFWLGRVKGSFGIRGGTADVADPVAASAIYAEIETASFRTKSRQRDHAVLSPRFLDPAGHPVMIFRSDRVGAEGQTLTGTLMVRGTARPVTLTVNRCEVSRGSFTVCATARIDRTEFGITAARGLAARYLDLTVEAQCTRN
jgi:polyisoprenoid-binding protein YceI